jgi:hypothetical protein
MATLADTYTLFSTGRNFRQANNSFDRNASKHDQTSDSATVALREAAYPPGDPLRNGFRTHLTQMWAMHWGVNFEANYDAARGSDSTGQRREWPGLRSYQAFVGSPEPAGFVNDQSQYGGGAGGGDYRPAAGSPLLGRVIRGNSDVDWAGVPRAALAASGALEPAP